MRGPEEFREGMAQLGAALSSPITVELEVTYKCNNYCQFCYNVWKKDQSQKTSEADMVTIIDRLREADVKILFFTGGEPLSRKDIFDLIEYAREGKMNPSIVTNGTLLTEEKAEKLKALKAGVQVSLHGTEKTHDFLVGVKGAYAQTMKGLEILRDLKVPTNINITLTLLNYRDLPSVGEVAHTMGAHLSMTRLVLTGEPGKNLQFTRKTIPDLMNFLLQQEHLKKASIQSPFPLCCLGEEGFPRMVRIYDMFDIVGCQGGITWCAVSPEGKVRICGAMGREEGDLKENDLRTIWKTSEMVQKSRTFSHVPQKCLECEYLSMCTGGCRADAYASFGSISAPDPLSVL